MVGLAALVVCNPRNHAGLVLYVVPGAEAHFGRTDVSRVLIVMDRVQKSIGPLRGYIEIGMGDVFGQVANSRARDTAGTGPID